jgi:hypothetical protein
MDLTANQLPLVAESEAGTLYVCVLCGHEIGDDHIQSMRYQRAVRGYVSSLPPTLFALEAKRHGLTGGCTKAAACPARRR